MEYILEKRKDSAASEVLSAVQGLDTASQEALLQFIRGLQVGFELATNKKG